jgi:two-component system, OmpR family, KDP operon response regulator KdpE
MARSRAADVLVVEDDNDCLGVYVSALTLAGFQCLASRTPNEAVRLAARSHFDVVVMDLGLPRLADGLTLAWQLSAVANAPQLIAISGHRLNAAPPLFRILLWKPVDLDDLVDTVRRVLAERGWRPAL